MHWCSTVVGESASPGSSALSPTVSRRLYWSPSVEPKAPSLGRFADQLEPYLGLRPDLTDLAGLIAALYKLGEQEKTLAIIDELPYLLPLRAEQRYEVLTSVQAVMEERGASMLKLVLCGSYIGQMTALLSETSPLRGRLTPLAVEPLRFADAQAFAGGSSPRQRIESYAVAGGTSLYRMSSFVDVVICARRCASAC